MTSNTGISEKHAKRLVFNVLVSLGLALSFAASARAIECPATIADIPAEASLAQVKEYSKCCWGATGSGCEQEATQGKMTCEKLRVINSLLRINAGTPEAQAAMQLEKDKCSNKPNDTVIAPQQENPGTPEPTYVNGIFRGERGYYNHYTGAKRRICEPYYSFTMVVQNGRAEFNSGGHTWTGVVNANGNILINEDGVYPRPKNKTAIIGPVDDASLYNGYCGSGFFRIVGPA